MNVLVVDDQLHVVEGILSGVCWKKAGVERVWGAYSAFEARQILLREQVDILLCDIEMPVENGLSLYRWVKEQGLPLECVFLTAHADFAYAKEALQLGGFDYILQPVRYEEIQNTLLRIQRKILANREALAYTQKGRAFSRNQDLYLDGILQEFFTGGGGFPTLAAGLEVAGLAFGPEQVFVCALLQFVGDCADAAGWEENVLRYAMNNILSELMGLCRCHVLLAHTGEQNYGMLLYFEEEADMALLRSRFELFRQVLEEQLGFAVACYLGRPEKSEALSRQVADLQKRRADNVAFQAGLFVFGEEAEVPEESERLETLLRKWSAMLTGRNVLPVREELHAYLDGQLNKWNAHNLKYFYQRLTQMLTVAGEQRNIRLQEELGHAQLLDEYLTAYRSVNQMHRLIDTLIPYFQTPAPEEEKGQVDRVLQYIYGHLEDDIRRTDLAREVFLNPDYLTRIFKKEMGVSLKEFITAEKMKAAKVLLKSTSLPVGTIAVRVGYNNFSHFSQTYKRSMGVSPEEERR